MTDVAQRVAEHPGWYHTIELAPGVETPGSCDLRPLAPMALPASLAGRRCLDVGTFDGFWAFELEARGAAEVLALDLPDIAQADLPPVARAALERERAEAGGPPPPWGGGFRLAHEARGSSVRRVEGNVYDLDAGLLGGPVDLVLCGTLLQHLRDPVRALERIRNVVAPGGEVLLVETVSRSLCRWHRRRPVAEFRPAVEGWIYTWWAPNLAALRGWAAAAGLVPAERPHAVHRPIRGAGRDDRLVALRCHLPRP